jgi:hypothetical protein
VQCSFSALPLFDSMKRWSLSMMAFACVSSTAAFASTASQQVSASLTVRNAGTLGLNERSDTENANRGAVTGRSISTTFSPVESSPIQASQFMAPELVDPTLAKFASTQTLPHPSSEPFFVGGADEGAGAVPFAFADDNGFMVQEITPVSEPATSVSAALAVGLIGWSGRRRLFSLWKSGTKWSRQNRLDLLGPRNCAEARAASLRHLAALSNALRAKRAC